MAFGRNGADRSDEAADRKDDKKTQPDQRCSLQAAAGKVGISRPDGFVEADNLLVELCADTTDQEITVGTHQAQDDGPGGS
jgi:hypothetical protein